MKKINNDLIDETVKKAELSERQRMNYNFHRSASDTLHRMLNAMEPDTYVAPHKHQDPDKREAFILLRGRMLVIEFDEHGSITDYIVLDHSTGDLGTEIAPGQYHTLLSLKKGTVIYEVKDGPYNPDDDKHFAPWAPSEGDIRCKEYMEYLVESTIKSI